MCYSAMVQQNAKKLGIQFKARVQFDMYEDLFRRRLKEKLYINKGMEFPFLNEAKSIAERGVGKAIRKWHEEEIARLNDELAKQEVRLKNAIASLKEKETKKALEDKRISSNKIDKFKADIQSHRDLETLSESDERIFPFHYVSMLCLDENGEKVIRPFRYLMRPHNKDQSFDMKFGGCYNARFDSINKVPWWKDSLQSRHGILAVKRFFENVPTEKYLKHNKLPKEARAKDNIVVCFEPEGVEYMYIPTLWDKWGKRGGSILYSTALITDDPAPEIARAGHDRTPIFLKESAIDEWLNAIDCPFDVIQKILSNRESPYYSHRVLGIAA